MVEYTMVRRYKKLTPDQRKAAIARLKAGGTVQSVSEAMGLSLYAVKKIKSDSVHVSDAMTTEHSPVINFRLSKVEAEELDNLVSKFCFKTRSDLMRTLVRAAEGMLEFDKETTEELKAVNRNLVAIGRNIDQIAKAANTHRVELVVQYWDDIHTVKAALDPLRIYLRRIIKEQRRRGAILFLRYIEAQRG